MTYIKLEIALPDEYHEPLIAELSEMGFDGFEQRDHQVITYIEKGNLAIADREQIEQLLAGFPGHCFIEKEEVVEDQNWNEQWEQTVGAREIGRFFVKPTWSTDPVPGDKILLEIDPKMSFGTGYHETTRLILKLLPGMVRRDDTVIDAGTGTAILSIAAVKLGASRVLAFDTDEWSIKNARENILLNGVDTRITVVKGSTEVVPATMKADLLLANIQRNVILELLPDFIKSLKKGGNMVLSGLVESDRADIRRRLSQDARVIDIQQENEWIAIHAQAKK
ncbi:[LSU ribosomal protein L11P]-lysine N-methyltransferase [Fodinibius roseus]|uniref:Ribosomal protein L11 methyltransferase n=1 Tax=Fodinibius roseus TaxID=1194090 RepID=A0A1M5C4U7_9BACT|nr:50S ribosomal protein L11 methyltransferase [Fodinibius roseus]SHF49794.1 [LSU ribosomal protein L11P]-lysine N-methyltransferase [Fodinibius roseus]